MGNNLESPNPYLVLYDDQCPMCTFQMRLLSWLDWRNQLQLTALSDESATSRFPSLTPEALRSAIHCVTPKGTIHRGARCLRAVGMQIPALIPLSLVLWIPGVIWIAEIVYQWVSRNRYILSKLFGCKEACSVLPQRQKPRPPTSS